ncbi:MAG: FlgO family outer membrane protein [Desulfobulbaceae bacterium]|nr:FlgO family outer membrane protein [Desulfobulbaceae bacterium]
MKKSITHTAICGIGLGLLMNSGCATMPFFDTDKAAMARPVPAAEPVMTEEPVASAPVATAAEAEAKPAPAAAPSKEAVAVPTPPKAPEPAVAPVPAPSAMAKTAPAVYKYAPDSSNSLGTEKQLSEFCREIAGKVYYELKQNGEKHLSARVAVVDAVPLSDLKRESEFGRLVSEYMLTDLADRGIKVTELRLGKEISILPQTGEFILSRNIGELATDSPMIDYVLVSTFSNTRKTLILQGRLVALQSGLVETSWRYTLPLNRELLGLFHSPEQPFTIAVNGMNR